jgi:steroid 5-alpha reductase family enzyme
MFEIFMTNAPLLSSFAISMGIQWVGWAISSYFHTEKFFDLTGSATFLLLSHLSHSRSIQTNRQTVQYWMVTAWACRLGTLLFVRVMKSGGDRRFDTMRDQPSRLLVAWTLQGIWVFVTLLPTLMMNESKSNTQLTRRDYIGWGIWAFGFIMEVVADYQKSAFKNIPQNKDKFIDSGLWSISRHPNYFGEICLWFGLYITASSVFKGWQFMAVLSPTLVCLLITKVSGIPLLEKAGLKKWGHLPEYQKYLQDTASLVPFIKL